MKLDLPADGLSQGRLGTKEVWRVPRAVGSPAAAVQPDADRGATEARKPHGPADHHVSDPVTVLPRQGAPPGINLYMTFVPSGDGPAILPDGSANPKAATSRLDVGRPSVSTATAHFAAQRKGHRTMRVAGNPLIAGDTDSWFLGTQPWLCADVHLTPTAHNAQGVEGRGSGYSWLS